MEEKTWLVYCHTNKSNGKMYIGKHTQEFGFIDDYMGSGKIITKAIDKYGLENFKKDILDRHHIRFIEDVHMFEDVLFLFEYLKFCDKIKFNDKSLYNYVIAEGESLSTKVNSFESEYLGFITFYNQIIDDFKITIPELINDFPKLGYRLTRLMNRSISTIYIKDYPTKKTILALHNYPKNAWILYNVFNEPSNIIKKWSKILLVKNMFRSADFLLRISYKLIK